MPFVFWEHLFQTVDLFYAPKREKGFQHNRAKSLYSNGFYEKLHRKFAMMNGSRTLLYLL